MGGQLSLFTETTQTFANRGEPYMYLSLDSTITVKANPRKLFPSYIPQTRYEHVLADSCAECLGGTGSGPAERSARGESPGATVA